VVEQFIEDFDQEFEHYCDQTEDEL